ncbi:MAG: insulinase family protein [Planctomycetes bacterium]|nr:insulinase family protein [Planctomycetota bacterium]
MTRITKAILLSCLLLLCGDCAGNRPLPDIKPVREENPRHPLQLKIPVQQFKIPHPERLVMGNGLPVYLLEDHSAPVISIILKFKTGSKYDPAGKYGLANLTAAVLESGGTVGMDSHELFSLFDNKKVEFSITAGPDFTVMRAAFLSNYAADIMPVFFDIIRNPALTAEITANEKKIAIEELARIRDYPGNTAYVNFLKDIYKEHPYGREAAGTSECIESISREDITAFHYKYYRPNNALMGIAGDFSKEDIIGRIAKECETWKGNVINPPTIPEMAKEEGRLRILLSDRELQQSYMVIGQIGVPKRDNGYFPLLCLNTILGGCFSSRLVEQIRSEKGYAYGIGSEFSFFEDSGVFYAELQTETENTSAVLKLVLENLNKICVGMVKEEELEFAKDYLSNNFIFQFQTPARTISNFMDLELYEMDADFYDKYLDNIQRLSREGLLTAAKKYFTPDRLTISIVGRRDEIFSRISGVGEITELKDK